MRYFITGVGGQLGHDIVQELKERGEQEIFAPTREELNINNRDQVMLYMAKVQPDVIFHCAAYTKVDKAEEEKEACYQTNVMGTKNLVDASLALNAKFIYISTDYVFDGTKEGAYQEEDLTNPKSVYGMTKYLGEKIVETNPNHYIARVSWVFGKNGGNFVKTMLRLSETHKDLNVVSDQIGSPTYTRDLAKMLVTMSDTDQYGTYHLTNSNYCSWADFAKYILKEAGATTEVHEVSTEEYLALTGTKQAYRPRNSKLSKQRLETVFGETLPSWQDATKRYLKEIKIKK